jgi:hypothetical protein
MVRKKGDLAFTVIQLPALYPALDIISQLTPVPCDAAVCLDIAPKSSSSVFKQVALQHFLDLTDMCKPRGKMRLQERVQEMAYQQ